MLARSSLRKRIAVRSLHTAVALGVTFVPSAARADRTDDCNAATTVTLGSTVHDYGDPISTLRIFKVQPSGPGMLSVAAASPGDSPQPKLLFLGTDCVDPDPADPDYTPVAEGTATAVEWIEDDGTFYVQVSPEDPEKTLSGVKLTTAWSLDLSTESEDPEPVDLSIGPTDPPTSCGVSATPIAGDEIGESWYGEVVQGIQEWDGDVLSGAFEVPGILRVSAPDGHLSADIHNGQSCGRTTGLAGGELADPADQVAAVLYPGTYSLLLAPEDAYGYSLDVKYFALCPTGSDQGDTHFCGAPLTAGVSASGALDNATDDDEDFFTFVLASQRTVEIESTGSVDTFGSLYDKQGTLIATDDDAGSGDNFRLVKNLAGGRYFVRVEGVSGAEGSYGLDLALVAEP